MPPNDLQNLLSQNNLAAFFRAWPEVVHPTSPLNASLRSLRADWNAALEDFIQDKRADDGSKGIREKAFALVDRVGAADLEERVAEPSESARPTDADDELRELQREQLSFFRKTLIIAVSPAEKFRLMKDIAALERALGE